MRTTIHILVILIFPVLIVMFASCKQTVRENEAGGTIGQVKKYRKDQMSEKDILLRSEVMKDTSKLSEIIQGLVFFNAYATTLEKNLGERLVDMQSVSDFNETYGQYITELSDFRDFLKNNNIVLTNTIMMLADFYNDTISESSADVENNLRAFANYIRQMEEKDSVLTVTVNNLDAYIAENEQSVVDKEEIDRLKAIRDELFIRIVQEAYLLDNPEALSGMVGKKFYTLDDKIIPEQNMTDELNVAEGIGVEILSDLPIVIEGFFSGENAPAAPAGGGPLGSGQLPANPPGNPSFGTGVPLVLQELVLYDQGIIRAIDFQENIFELTGFDTQLGDVVRNNDPGMRTPESLAAVSLFIGSIADFCEYVEELGMVIEPY